MAILLSTTGLLVYLKLLNDRIEDKVKTFYKAGLTISTIVCLLATIYTGLLLRGAYWSKLSQSDLFAHSATEESKWNTVLISLEYSLLVAMFSNLVDVITKGLVFSVDQGQNPYNLLTRLQI